MVLAAAPVAVHQGVASAASLVAAVHPAAVALRFKPTPKYKYVKRLNSFVELGRFFVPSKK